MWLWGLSIICEIWFAFSWILDILPKLNPINRATDLAALKDKFEQPSPSNPNGRSDLPGVDVFVSTADPEKEPPLVTANTILSILATDYPVEKLACYLSDDGGAILTFEAMAEAVMFSQVSHKLFDLLFMNVLQSWTNPLLRFEALKMQVIINSVKSHKIVPSSLDPYMTHVPCI